MDRPTLKIPLESLSQVFRKTQKHVTKELGAVLEDIGRVAEVMLIA